jgi:hypothetical protein
VRAAILLAGAGLLCVALVLAAAGHRNGRAALGPVLAAVGVAFGAYLSVDCRQCHSGALYIGALVSLPFFLIAWVVLAFDAAGVSPWTVRAVIVLCAFQAAWASLITATTTFGGACPCGSELWSGTAGPPSLRAIGMDRLVGPLLLICAGITAALAARGRRRAA